MKPIAKLAWLLVSCSTLAAGAQTTPAPAPEFKPGIPGLAMADVREHKHLWREIEELQTWERGDRISIAEFRAQVIEKTAQFLGYEGAVAGEFTAVAGQSVVALRESFKAGRATNLDPSDPVAPFAADLTGAVTRLNSQLRETPRHQLFGADLKKWLLRLAFGPSEAKEAKEAKEATEKPTDGSQTQPG
jgi:hypothetical protein